MNTLSQCRVRSCKSIYERNKTSVCDCTVWRFSQRTCSLQAFDFPFQKKAYRRWGLDQLIVYVCLLTKGQNHVIQVSCRTKLTGLELRWAFSVPTEPSRGNSSGPPWLPFRTMSSLSLAYIHKLQHTEEFLQKHAGPVSWLTLAHLWNRWALSPRMLSTFCLTPERDPPSQQRSYTQTTGGFPDVWWTLRVHVPMHVHVRLYDTNCSS